MNDGWRPIRWRDRLKPRFRTVLVDDDFPEVLAPRKLYVLNEGALSWTVAMSCPCGCGTDLHLNLLSDQRPCWRLSRRADGTASLIPSVWSKRGCGAHFWFRSGRVFWTRDQPNRIWRDIRLWLR